MHPYTVVLLLAEWAASQFGECEVIHVTNNSVAGAARHAQQLCNLNHGNPGADPDDHVVVAVFFGRLENLESLR